MMFLQIKPGGFVDEPMNLDFDFPVAACYGSRDMFGSDFIEEPIKANKYFESGYSMLFKISNSGHNTCPNNSEELCEKMIGFFDGTLTHVFEPKPRA